MPGFYIAFHQRYPFIKLQLSNYIRYEHMFMYDCDFCITADAGFTPLAGNSVIPILTERFVLAVQKQHPLAGRESIHLKEAAPYPFVASNRREDLEFYCLKAGFRPNIIAECDNGTTYETFLRNGWDIRGSRDNPGFRASRGYCMHPPHLSCHRAHHQPDL